MAKNHLPIIKCRSCKSSNLKTILTLGNFYLSEFRKDNKKPKAYPLNLVFCKECFLLQLKETAPTSVLYTDNYGYRSGINNTMKKELEEIVKKSLEQIGKKKNITAVDIGANDGTLLSFYPKAVKKIAIEPINKFAKESSHIADVVINDFFNFSSFQNKLKNKKADIITAISCFYDIDNPNIFIEDITKIMDKDGVFVIQQNYLKLMLQRKAFDNIVHEHLEYYSLISLENLLVRHGLEVFDVELSDINGGSFRTFIAFKGQRKISYRVGDLLKSEKKIGLSKNKIYEDFAKHVKKTGQQTKQFIQQEARRGKRTYVYGASTRGNTLLQFFKLDSSLILKAVERNPEKYGTKIASVGIPIISEEQARKEHPDYMLVLPWFFKDEFLKREKEYLRNGGHFIFPLPNLEII